MKEVYLLFRTDNWHSVNSKELVFIGDSVDKCCWAAHWQEGASNEQVKQLKWQNQSQCNNRENEFEIERWEVNKINRWV